MWVVGFWMGVGKEDMEVGEGKGMEGRDAKWMLWAFGDGWLYVCVYTW